MIQKCPGFDEMPKGVEWTLYWIVRCLPGRQIVELGEFPVMVGVTDALVCGAKDVSALGKQACDIKSGMLCYQPHYIEPYGAKVTGFYNKSFIEQDTDFFDGKQKDTVEAGLDWRKEPVDMLVIGPQTYRSQTNLELTAWRKWIRLNGVICLLASEGEWQEQREQAIVSFLDLRGDEWTYEKHKEISFLWREK